MKLAIVNAKNEKVGDVDLRDDVFGRRPRTDLIWEAVVHANAAERRGTHATKNRALVSGSGKKPWRQKGTGRARVGEVRNPLWRKGGTVFGPQPRSYDYDLPKKVRRGALRDALAGKIGDGAVVVVDRLASEDGRTKTTAAMLKELGVTGKTLIIDVNPDDRFALSARNIAGVRLVPSARVTARDVMDTKSVIVAREALAKLQETLG
jgi:large subunit ribosomal protein L4